MIGASDTHSLSSLKGVSGYLCACNSSDQVKVIKVP